MKSRTRANLVALMIAVGLAPVADGRAWGQEEAFDVQVSTGNRRPAPSTAEAIYDSVGERLRALDKTLFDGLPSGADDPQAVYFATGVADERMTRWLVGARPLGEDLVRASGLPYERLINPQDGFTLGPAHLAPLRATNQSLAVLVHDAAVRGDRTGLVELLRAQVVIAARTASDGTLPSSISAINAIQTHMYSVEKLLDNGFIDEECARQIVDMRATLAQRGDFGVVTAIRAELEAMRAELERIILTPFEERPAAVAGLRVTAAITLDDDSIHAARQGAEAYLLEVAAAIASEDLAAARNRIAFAERRLHDGAYGELLKLLAPQLLPVADLLIQLQGGLEAQRTTLDSIVRGTTSSVAHADAGWFYQLAARDAWSIPLDAQAAIDSLRAPTSAPTVGVVRTARSAIDARRATIIEPLLAASRAPRCSLPTHPPSAAGAGFARACSGGMNAAVRVLLADAFGPGTRPTGAPTRAESVAAAMRIALHFSKLGSYAHALVAQQILRDLVDPVAELDARGELTVQLREELGAIAERLSSDDPAGFLPAVDAERAWLGSRSIADGGLTVATFDRAQLENLTPNEIGFLLAMFTPAKDAPFDAPRGGPLDGALVDTRAWFDLAAFKRAFEQRSTLERRAIRSARGERDAALATDPSRNAVLAWLDVAYPIDVEATMRDAKSAFERLGKLIAPKAAATGDDVSVNE